MEELKYYVLSQIEHYKELKVEGEYSPHLDVYYDLLGKIEESGEI